jgi:phage major head subunit gpT-like protein
MLTRADISRLLTSGLKTQFMKGMKGIDPIYTKYTTEIPSTKESETLLIVTGKHLLLLA